MVHIILDSIKHKKHTCQLCKKNVIQNETLGYYKHLTIDEVTGMSINDYERIHICNTCYKLKKISTFLKDITQCKCGLYIPKVWTSRHLTCDCLTEGITCEYCTKVISRYEKNNDLHNCNNKLFYIIQDMMIKQLRHESEINELNMEVNRLKGYTSLFVDTKIKNQTCMEE
jgi:hypothetical protein